MTETYCYLNIHCNFKSTLQSPIYHRMFSCCSEQKDFTFVADFLVVAFVALVHGATDEVFYDFRHQFFSQSITSSKNVSKFTFVPLYSCDFHALRFFIGMARNCDVKRPNLLSQVQLEIKKTNNEKSDIC